MWEKPNLSQFGSICKIYSLFCDIGVTLSKLNWIKFWNKKSILKKKYWKILYDNKENIKRELDNPVENKMKKNSKLNL